MDSGAGRAARIGAMDDVGLLRALLRDAEVTVEEKKAFGDMLAAIDDGERAMLSRKQRAWAEEVMSRVTPILANEVPRGKPVETPTVLRNLPKRPPPRRTEE